MENLVSDVIPLDERLTKLSSQVIGLNTTDLDELLNFIELENYRMISLEENALLRAYHPNWSKYNSIQEGNTTKECFIYVPNKGTFLSKHEHFPSFELEIIKSPDQYKRFFFKHSIFDNPLKNALKDSIKIEETDIPTNRFGEDKVTDYIFGRVANDYGYFLKGEGIEVINVKPPQNELGKKPFAQLVWFANSTSSGGNSNIKNWNYGRSLLRLVKDE